MYHSLVEDITNMGVIDQVFNFVTSLHLKLATKMVEKRKEFKTLKAWYDHALYLVVNKAELKKCDRKPFDKEDKGKSHHNTSLSNNSRKKCQWEGGSKEMKPKPPWQSNKDESSSFKKRKIEKPSVP